MNHLPVEVLLNVFSFVPKKELITTIPQVCRRWKDVAADPSLFRTLDLVNDVPDTGTSIRLLSAATWLTSLVLSGRTDTDVLIQHIGVDHPRLVELVFYKCRGSQSKEDVSDIDLLHLVRRCSTLQQFTLLETLCYSEVLYTDIGVNLHDLRVFMISFPDKFDSNSLNSITNHCNRIEKFYLLFDGFELLSTNAVANFCDKFKESLTSFALHTSWTNESLASMSRCRIVKELTLRHTVDITDEGIMLLCQMTKLESLTILRSENITSMGWVTLFENPSMKSLVKLTLVINNLDDLAISAIGLLPNLSNLFIFGYDITDEGLLSLSNTPNLSRLTIWYNQNITLHGWIRFFETNNVQQKMTHLKLESCTNVDDDVIQIISLELRILKQMEIS